MKKIIIDTNFLLIPTLFHVDIFKEIERICEFPYTLCIIEKTINELDSIIQKQKGKHKRAAIFSLDLIKQKSLYILTISNDNTVDDIILDLADKEKFIVATQDRELKQRLKKKDIGIISLRQRSYLVIENVL